MSTADWNDAGRLRERLSELRGRRYLSLCLLGVERAVVARIASLTGLTVEQIRLDADRDLVHKEGEPYIEVVPYRSPRRFPARAAVRNPAQSRRC